MRGRLALVLLFAAACSDRNATKAAADSNLSRDLALASSVQLAQPAFKDTAVAPTPTAARPVERAPAPKRIRSAPSSQPRSTAVQSAPQSPVQSQAPAVATAPTPAPAPAPLHKEIAAGTGFALTSGTRVCTNSNLPGDKVVATLNSPVTGTNGAVIPSGSTVVLEVAAVTPGSTAETTQITFRVRSIFVNGESYPASGDVTTATTLEKTKVQGQDPNADKKKVIGGAIAGAILGQIIGKNTKSTIIGAAAGAATGAAAAKMGEKWEGCLPEGSALQLTLSAPVVMS